MAISIIIWVVIAGVLVITMAVRIFDDHRSGRLGFRHNVKGKTKIRQ